MILLFTLVSLVVFPLADSAKILIYDYKFQRSHVQFINIIADILVDEGHDVVMHTNVLDANLRDVGSKRVRRFFTEQSPEALAIGFSRLGRNNWEARGFYDWLTTFGVRKYFDGMTEQCLAVLQDEKLIEQIREEKFDVALTTPNDLCVYYIFHMAGITNYAMIDSHSTLLFPMWYTGAPDQYSTLPGRFAAYSEMTFSNRLKNFLTDSAIKFIPMIMFNDFFDKIEATFEHAPDLYELMANVSMVFINRIPAIEFPSLTTHTIVDIGGLTIPKSNSSLDEHWDAIFSLRPRTVLISFGTIALSSDMPEGYKQSFLQAIKSFPDITFVWKYENPDHNISASVENLVEASFIPQKQILQDPRLSLFITHCGWASTLETMMAGVPVIAIPTSTDQHRNAQVLKRGGGGIVMDKKELESEDVIEKNIREILENERYQKSAREIATIIKNSPYSGRENFFRNLNFLIKFGPLPSMRIPSHKQTFIEHNMLDVYAILSVVSFVILFICYVILKYVMQFVVSFGVRKIKNE